MRPSFTPGRKWKAVADAVLGCAALLVIVVLVNYLSATRGVWRHELGAGAQAELSPLTLQTLAALTNEVKVTVLFAKESGLRQHVDALLRQYAAQSPRISLRFVDPVKNPEISILIRDQYKLGSRSGQAIVFDYGSGNYRVVGESELSVYRQEDVRSLVSGHETEVHRSGFLGELRFTAALAALTEGAELQAVYINNHGEHRFDSEDSNSGYAGFGRLLTKEKNLILHSLNLATNEIPDTCRLAILAGPEGLILPGELAKLDRFLKRGGSLLVLLNPSVVDKEIGLDTWLRHWSVGIAPAFAGDTNASFNHDLDLDSGNFGSHPITTPLKRNNGVLYFPLPRVVVPIPTEGLGPDAPKAELLAATSDSGMTMSDVRDSRIGFDPVRDRKNWQVPLAVAVEKGGVAGVAAGRGTARLVVIGASYMFANNALEQPMNRAGNHEFAALCVSWLLDRPQSLVIGPRPLREWKVNLTNSQWRVLKWTLYGGLPGAAVLAGFVVWLRGRA